MCRKSHYTSINGIKKIGAMRRRSKKTVLLPLTDNPKNAKTKQTGPFGRSPLLS